MAGPLPPGFGVVGVRSRHEAELMRYPNVVGVADGTATHGGEPTDEACIVVYVTTKVSASELSTSEVLPTSLEGVRVDVVEVGTIEAQGPG